MNEYILALRVPPQLTEVPQVKIQKLYENDAIGLLDEDLLDDVGCSLYARCESILMVTESSYGRVSCPQCGHIIIRHHLGKGSREEILLCSNCSFQFQWEQYHRSYDKKQLHGGGAVEIFKSFVSKYPNCKETSQKMIAIDNLLHSYHTFCKNDLIRYNRPVAVNLIEGNMKEVVHFLDFMTDNLKPPSHFSGL